MYIYVHISTCLVYKAMPMMLLYIYPYLFSVEGDADDAVIYNIHIYKSLPV